MTDTISKAEITRIINAIRDEAPAPTWNDSGATADGWQMACKAIEKAVIETAGGASPFDLAERAFPDKFWLFGKGRASPDEPLYGFRVFEPGNADEPIAESEHDDPLECVRLAVQP